MRFILPFLCIFALTACFGGDADPRDGLDARDVNGNGGGLPFFGGNDDDDAGENGLRDTPGLRVNPYLWTASLDTLDFMPIQSTDPVGGVIAFDWFADPRKPDERFRATVYITDMRLRADALRVRVFSQTFDDRLGWVDQAVSEEVDGQVENAILNRARELRLTLQDDA